MDHAEILDRVKLQVDRLMLEPCSPVEAQLVNAVAILASVLRTQYAPQDGKPIVTAGMSEKGVG